MERTFCLSDDIFGGFKSTVDLMKIQSIEEIILQVYKELYIVLKVLNLEILCLKLTKLRFHIHDCTLDMICQSEPNSIFYICSHQHINEKIPEEAAVQTN